MRALGGPAGARRWPIAATKMRCMYQLHASPDREPINPAAGTYSAVPPLFAQAGRACRPRASLTSSSWNSRQLAPAPSPLRASTAPASTRFMPTPSSSRPRPSRSHCRPPTGSPIGCGIWIGSDRIDQRSGALDGVYHRSDTVTGSGVLVYVVDTGIDKVRGGHGVMVCIPPD